MACAGSDQSLPLSGDGKGGFPVSFTLFSLGPQNPLNAFLRNFFLSSEEMLAVWVMVFLLFAVCLKTVLMNLKINIKKKMGFK
ncbi:hypothetical protein [Maridesulfovibrio sp.]|uniref:hypothetical protein n=1 Tax=Maridesulfovibrio sp. TaxID=2795000 RepID=UPI002A189AA0|nr:hypothetical protein [Maridesulfovibrio sp.]